jgi:hypothetical protein
MTISLQWHESKNKMYKQTTHQVNYYKLFHYEWHKPNEMVKQTRHHQVKTITNYFHYEWMTRKSDKNGQTNKQIHQVKTITTISLL